MVGTALLGVALAAPIATDPLAADVAVDAGIDPIMNGVEELEHPAAVGLGLDGLGVTICSGSLITPELVLTAAHCTADFPEELVTALGVAFFGTRPLESDSRPIADVLVHPAYLRLDPEGSTLGEYDVALIRLGEPANVDPVWFREARFTDDVEGTTVVSVGWGVDENDVSYVKRSAELVVDELDPMFLISRASKNPNSTSICSGDSGGPQYEVQPDGSLLQWSVHSWASTRCQGESGSVRTDVVADWILEHVADVHGAPDRCTAWGQYGDGVCDSDCAEPDPDCPRAYGAAQVRDGPASTQGFAGEGCSTVGRPVDWLGWLARR